MKSWAGFTLIELLLALTITVIGMLMTVSSFQYLVGQSRSSAAANDLYHLLNFARQAALGNGQVVTVCKSADGLQCGGDWSQGILVFVDEQANGRVDPDDEILRVFKRPVGDGSLDWRAFPSNKHLQYSPQATTREQNGTFYYCPLNKDESYGRAIIVDKSGRVRVSREDEDRSAACG